MNNLRFIIRRLGRQKIHTSLHIIGLTLGLCVCILIALFLQYELSFDGYHQKAERIFRVNQIWEGQGQKEYDHSTFYPMSAALREEVPFLEYVSIANHTTTAEIEINPTKRFKHKNVLSVEPDFLDIFDIEVIEGNGHEALRQPFHALLTESTAEKFFGREAAVGKTFLYKNEFEITVGGIIKDLPNNTHLPATMLMAYVDNEDFNGHKTNQWNYLGNASTYVVLPSGYNQSSLDQHFVNIFDTNIQRDKEDAALYTMYAELQPLSQIHLDPKWDGGGTWVNAINPVWLWFFGALGLTVLLLACINFVNLSTAQAITRSKEVGIRKAIGAGRSQLIRQFISEALLLISASSILAIALAQITLPYLNNLIEKKINFAVFYTPSVIFIFLLSILLIGFLTGIYPAWLTSKFQPALTLKSGAKAEHHNTSFLRKSLVVAQFSISITFLAALILMSQQMEYFYNRNLGFNKENIINIDIPDHDKQDVFKNELSKISEIEGISFALHAPGEGQHWETIMSEIKLSDPGRQDLTVIWADDQYPTFYDLELKAGRYYEAADTNYVSKSLASELRSPKVIVNETLVQKMGYASAEDAISKKFFIGVNDYQVEIVGVVGDFNVSSLHEAIQPTLITQYPRFHTNAGIKIKAGDHLPKTLAKIESTWKDLYPKGFYNMKFLDETIQKDYKAESQLFSLFKLFAGLAMFISCMGLWGLATFAALQRTKEIGIRKVLGASTVGIVQLLSKDFLKLVLLAIVIAAPIAWYGMSRWLENFAYRIDIDWKVFLVTGIIAIIIAVITISFQSIKVALTNPTKALKNE